jgi:hypothetical protein
MDSITALIHRNQTLLDKAAKTCAATAQIVALLAEAQSRSIGLVVETALLIDQCRGQVRGLSVVLTLVGGVVSLTERPVRAP